jgi:hypothetical protein
LMTSYPYSEALKTSYSHSEASMTSYISDLRHQRPPSNMEASVFQLTGINDLLFL